MKILIKAVLVSALICVVALVLFGQGRPSSLYRAFMDHERNQDPRIKAYYPMAGGEAFVLSQRWKNYQKDVSRCPSIGEVVSVGVEKTSDAGEFVITLVGIDAKEDKDGFDTQTCSLWLASGTEGEGIKVRSLVPY